MEKCTFITFGVGKMGLEKCTFTTVWGWKNGGVGLLGCFSNITPEKDFSDVIFFLSKKNGVNGRAFK